MDPVILIPGLAALIALILFLPLKGAGSFRYEPPIKRFNEADAVLSRRLLAPGTQPYDNYYRDHPVYKVPDDRSREAPGLLSDHARLYQHGTFSAAKANFEIIENLRTYISGNPAPEMFPVDPDKTSRFLSEWLKGTGAHSVGCTPLREYHLYSHKGRGPGSGEPIEKRHEHAIAITVEMDHRMMQSAPGGTSVMESSEQYLRSGVLALKTAAFIRELGYQATAHIDGNYEVICPLVAVDAGLGTIGRMGLLMTPDLGPRVRIAVVTTSMPLVHSGVQSDRTTLHFCHHCTKCARACPAAAIPEGPRQDMDGAPRWQIDSENCYHYWTLCGTDCGRCIAVCPYGHPNNLIHHFIRRAIKNNLVFRHLAIKLDDIFYGRKPPVRILPEWTDILDKA